MASRKVACYTRVSTCDRQNPKVQERELREFAAKKGWQVNGVYEDKGVSGAKENRPALDRLMADCRKRKVDVVLVWKFDRFARSLRQLLSALQEFRDLGIDFVSCTEAIDTTTAMGEFTFAVFAAIAQFERSLIQERVKAGVLHARSIGKILGRPQKRAFTKEEIAEIRTEYQKGNTSVRHLAQKFASTHYTVTRILEGQYAAV